MYNASFKSLFSPGGGMCMHLSYNDSINLRHEYHYISMSCNGLSIIHATSQRTGNNETKAYPTIRICLLATLTGDCLSWNAQYELCEMPQGDKSQALKSKGDDAENPIWQRSSHSIQGVAVMVQHTGRLRVLLVRLPLKGRPSMRENRRRRTVIGSKIKNLFREENLIATIKNGFR